MNVRPLLFTLILLSALNNVYGQEKKKKKVNMLRVNSISILGGGGTERYAAPTLDDFRKLSSGSALLNKNFDSYGTRFDDRGYYGVASVLLGIQLRDKEKTGYRNGPSLRLGINYMSGTALYGNMNSEEKVRIDTLYNWQGENIMYIDSVFNEYYHLSRFSKQLRLDASLIYSLFEYRFLTIYGGLGINLGTSVATNTRIEFYKSGTEEYYNQYGNQLHLNEDYMFSSDNTLERGMEDIRNKHDFYLSLNFPIGIDIRISKRNFGDRYHFFYEIKPGYSLNSIPELRTIHSGSIYNMIGFRMRMQG